jgi:signal transduction histidine kinase
MSIRLKIAGSILLIFVLLSFILVIIAQGVLERSYADLELTQAERNAERLMNILQSEITGLNNTLSDWAYWDDTYAFVQGNNPEYPAINLTSEALGFINVDWVLITNAEGEMLVSLDVTDGTAASLADSADLNAYIDEIAGLVRLGDQGMFGVSGLLQVDEQLVLVASRMITDSRRTSDFRGTMTFGRVINASYSAKLTNTLLLPLSFFSLNAPDEVLPDDVTAVANEFRMPNNHLYDVTPLSNGALFLGKLANFYQMYGYIQLEDIFHQPVGIVRLSYPREISLQGRETTRFLAVLLVAGGLALSLIMLLLLDQLVARRIARLGSALGMIRAEQTLAGRVSLPGRDEVSQLADSVNDLLERLADSQQQLTDRNTALAMAYDKAREANRLKSQFLSTMSHELRTPLNSIIGYSYIMMEGMAGQLDDEANKMIHIIADSGNHLLNLINSILDLSKIEAGRMELVDSDINLHDWLESVRDQIAVLAANKGLAFTVEIDPLLPAVIQADEQRMTQILMNLLSNAVKFTEQGHIRLQVTRELVVGRPLLVLRVIDTGIGIPAHALTFIFDEFRQVDGSSRRAFGGTGLGLAIARKLARAMNGDISVESTVGSGSTFTVRLPLRESHKQPVHQTLSLPGERL